MNTNIVESTVAYETWLQSRIPLVQHDLQLKHQKMTEDIFQFMRATYYRWSELWPVECKVASQALKVMAVGDLHVQNFGTWCDEESRLNWGVNDLDEADQLAFTNDLVRLAASVELAPETLKSLNISENTAQKAVMEGYREQLDREGRPFVLEKKHAWLLKLARAALKDPHEFWEEWLDEKTVPIEKKQGVPDSARYALMAALPPNCKIEYRQRSEKDPQGLGSLGRERYFAYVEWNGGPLAREAKATVAAASQSRQPPPYSIFLQTLQLMAVRSPDPRIVLHDRWLVRPIASGTGRIDLNKLQQAIEKERITNINASQLLEAMGAETANIHLGSVSAKKLKKALEELDRDDAWLTECVDGMLVRLRTDFDTWKTHWHETQPT